MIYDLKAERSQVLDCGFQTADRRRSGSGTAQPPACGGQSTQNKANCPKRGTEAVSGGRDTPAFHCSIIPPSPPPARWDKASGVGDVRANRAEQTQFAPAGGRRWGKPHPTAPNKPNFPAGPGGTRPQGGGAGRPVAPNKPNLAPGQASTALAGANRTKQSQLPPGRRRAGTPYPRSEGPLCETNPMWARLGQGQVTGGRKMRNEPNLPPDRRAGPWLEPVVLNEPNLQEPAAGRRETIMQNKPNHGQACPEPRERDAHATKTPEGISTNAAGFLVAKSAGLRYIHPVGHRPSPRQKYQERNRL
jgi:hypothetical protein